MCVTKGGQITQFRRNGFTLLELLVVIAIIAILAGMLLAAVAIAVGHAHKTATLALIEGLKLSCDQYQVDWGVLPPDSPGDGSIPTARQANNRLFRALTTVVSRAGAPAMGGSHPFEPDNLDTRDLMNPNSLIVDSWGNPIMYDNNYSEGTDYRSSHDAKANEFDSTWTDSLPNVDFRSAGPDEEFGTDDDLSNSKR